MLKVGITGGIGSGKTTVCKVFELLGIPVFYADVVAKAIMHTDEHLKMEIKETFGSQSYFDNGELNRQYLSRLVFKDEAELEKLNSLVHPAVFRAFDNWLITYQNAPYVLKEAALLYESQSYKMCNYSILVKSPIEIKMKRIAQRDKLPAHEIKLRMDKQFTDEKKEKLADFVFLNDEQQLLIPQILDLHKHFLSL
jgi:dephospho-CoA kinase